MEFIKCVAQNKTYNNIMASYHNSTTIIVVSVVFVLTIPSPAWTIEPNFYNYLKYIKLCEIYR